MTIFNSCIENGERYCTRLAFCITECYSLSHELRLAQAQWRCKAVVKLMGVMKDEGRHLFWDSASGCKSG